MKKTTNQSEPQAGDLVEVTTPIGESEALKLGRQGYYRERSATHGYAIVDVLQPGGGPPERALLHPEALTVRLRPDWIANVRVAGEVVTLVDHVCVGHGDEGSLCRELQEKLPTAWELRQEAIDDHRKGMTACPHRHVWKVIWNEGSLGITGYYPNMAELSAKLRELADADAPEGGGYLKVMFLLAVEGEVYQGRLDVTSDYGETDPLAHIRRFCGYMLNNRAEAAIRLHAGDVQKAGEYAAELVRWLMRCEQVERTEGDLARRAS